MLRLAFDFIIAWREIRARPNAYTPLPNYTGTLTKRYRHTYSTVQAYECNYIRTLKQQFQDVSITIR